MLIYLLNFLILISRFTEFCHKTNALVFTCKSKCKTMFRKAIRSNTYQRYFHLVENDRKKRILKYKKSYKNLTLPIFRGGKLRDSFLTLEDLTDDCCAVNTNKQSVSIIVSTFPFFGNNKDTSSRSSTTILFWPLTWLPGISLNASNPVSFFAYRSISFFTVGADGVF